MKLILSLKMRGFLKYNECDLAVISWPSRTIVSSVLSLPLYFFILDVSLGDKNALSNRAKRWNSSDIFLNIHLSFVFTACQFCHIILYEDLTKWPIIKTLFRNVLSLTLQNKGQLDFPQFHFEPPTLCLETGNSGSL